LVFNFLFFLAQALTYVHSLNSDFSLLNVYDLNLTEIVI